jgi:hypothetical protein
LNDGSRRAAQAFALFAFGCRGGSLASEPEPDAAVGPTSQTNVDSRWRHAWSATQSIDNARATGVLTKDLPEGSSFGIEFVLDRVDANRPAHLIYAFTVTNRSQRACYYLGFPGDAFAGPVFQVNDHWRREPSRTGITHVCGTGSGFIELAPGDSTVAFVAVRPTRAPTAFRAGIQVSDHVHQDRGRSVDPGHSCDVPYVTLFSGAMEVPGTAR